MSRHGSGNDRTHENESRREGGGGPEGPGSPRSPRSGSESGSADGRGSGPGREPGSGRTGNAMVNDKRDAAATSDGTPATTPGTSARVGPDAGPGAGPDSDARVRADASRDVPADAIPDVRAHMAVVPDARTATGPETEPKPGASGSADAPAGGTGTRFGVTDKRSGATDKRSDVTGTRSGTDEAAPAKKGVGSGAGSVTVVGFGSRGDGGSDAPDLLDEVALRRMLHGVVRDIEPGDGALDQLRRAVPARRARRRQAAVGMAAAALLIGTAIPAFVHVANSDGSDTANPAMAGHGEQAQGGNGMESGTGAGRKEHGGGSDGQDTDDPDHPVSTSSPSGGGSLGADGNLVGGGSDPAASAASVPPVCDPGQLGVASAQAGAAGPDGTVYGTFRIANVSDVDCSVKSAGSIGFQALGAADPARITVVQHAAGDAATGLPDPSQEQGAVALKPSMAYEVRFAWVPKDTCPVAGGSPSPTPTEGTGGANGGSAAGPSTGSGDGAVATAAQLGSEDGGGLQDGSVAVTHTPEAGAPVAETKISNACAGTIYRTGVLAPAT